MSIYGGRRLDYEDIKKFTCNFSKERFISKFTGGTVYRGRIGDQDVFVKIWDNIEESDKGVCLFREEWCLFDCGNFKGYPKAVASCNDGKNPCAVVYDLNALDTVHNLIPKDNFLWVDRIKVAFGFASSLKSFHVFDWPFKIRNIDAAHILCDQEYTPILYDFCLISGGFLGQRWDPDLKLGSYGYSDPYFVGKGDIYSLKGSTESDIFAYGVVLLGLITKRVVNAEKDTESDFVNLWAEKEYEQKRRHSKKPSLVDESLKSQPYFDLNDGRKITNLAMKCIRFHPDERPDIDEVIKKLKGLKVVRRHGDETGINMVLKRI